MELLDQAERGNFMPAVKSAGLRAGDAALAPK